MVQEATWTPQGSPDPALEVMQCTSYLIVLVSRVTKARPDSRGREKDCNLMGSSKVTLQKSMWDQNLQLWPSSENAVSDMSFLQHTTTSSCIF